MKKPKSQGSTSSVTDKPASRTSCPIVGIGASAGGLEAFSQLLAALPPDTGMAFVLIQHLDPTHESLLRDALARTTRMPVEQIQDGMILERNHVYVIPPNADVGILKGSFTLLPWSTGARPPARAIDFFFRALAADQGNKAIGVVLSGTGTDGTEGLRAIKSEDGVTFAQEPRSAKFDGMPSSAVSAGVVDLTADIPRLAEALLRLARHPYVLGPAPEPIGVRDDSDLRKVLVLLRAKTGVDFSEYKPTTIRRRLARRMALRQQAGLQDYVKLLQQDPAEVKILFEDMLVNVTSFFRDAEVFEKLRQVVLPEIVKSKPEGGVIRIWVAGCSTGEEAYSIAICLLETLGENASQYTIQIFATDLSEAAVAKARAGIYSDSAVREAVTPARLQAFFTRTEGGYQINKTVRDLCIFVRHNLVSDPPFSKLDLLSCRNLLIYFGQALQTRLTALFHFALNSPGYLLLGRSENLIDPNHLFSVADKEARIFARTPTVSTLRLGPAPEARPIGASAPPSVLPGADFVRQAENLLLAQYAPPGVIVNSKWEILHFHGRTGPYLEPTPGQPQHNLLKMAREGLLADLRMALTEARESNAAVRRTGVRVRHGDSVKDCAVAVIPLPGAESQERFFLVLFQEVPAAQATPGAGGAPPASEPVASAAQELKATKDYLQTVIVEHQRTNDELISANEELVSSNEELQSLNEELQTAKEELQSTNEELTTLNDEMQNRNAQLNQVNADLSNLISSAEIPIVIVDGARRIRRFTSKAHQIMNLLPTDVGRPIDDIKSNLLVESLDREIAEVIDSVVMKESEIQDRSGHWYRLQIRPYLSTEKKVDGAVVSVIDIDDLKRALGAAEWARDYAAGVVEAFQTPILVLDEKLRVMSANNAYYTLFSVSGAETEGKSLFELGKGHWAVPALRGRLEDMLKKESRFDRFEVTCEPEGLGPKVLSVSARPIYSLAGVPMFLLAIEDITERKQGEAERSRLLAAAEEAQSQAERASRTKDFFLATLSHELRTPLSSLLLNAQLLRDGGTDPAMIERASLAIERAAKAQAQLIDDLLDVSRIAAGKLKIEFHAVSLPAIVRAAVETVRPTAEKKSLALEVTLDESLPPVSGDSERLQQVVLNLLTNAIKFTPAGGRIDVALDREDGSARLRVSDTGVGIESDFLPKLFNAFVQADPSSTRTHGGLGLGLTIARHLVAAHGGTIRAESPGKGKGATLWVTLPLSTGHAQEAAAPQPGAQPESRQHDLRGLRLLVVEDDPGTREALVEMLARSGAEVRATESASQTLAIFEEFGPDLLVCDIAMPDEDGYSLLGKIRALGLERHGSVPAVALTALASEEDRQRALSAGFQLHLSKPVDADLLVGALISLVPPAGGLPSVKPTPNR